MMKWFMIVHASIACCLLVITIAGTEMEPTHPRELGYMEPIFHFAPNGSATRYLDHYAGELSMGKCVAHCGCKGMNYGAILVNTSHCFCGNESPNEICGPHDECVMKMLRTDNISPSFLIEPPAIAKLFQSIIVVMTPSTDVLEYSILIDGKLSIFNTTIAAVQFTTPGTISMATEIEGYWGCRSDPVFIDVTHAAEVTLDCPDGAGANTEFNCSARIISGSSFTSLEFLQDSVSSSTIDLNGFNIEPMHYQVGGILKTDRFNDYEPTYDTENTSFSAFIDINNEFTSSGIIKAFEAYVTKRGCFKALVLMPTCADFSKMLYCNTMKKCLSTVDHKMQCLGGKDLMTFVAPETDGVFCSDSLRFTEEEQYGCGKVQEFQTPLADYRVVHSFKMFAEHLGNTVFTIPADEYIQVEPGYVLGWIPCTEDGINADIGSYPFEMYFEHYWPVYIYKEVFEFKDGGLFSADYPLTELKNISFMFQAHVFSSIAFTATFIGSAPSTKITASLSSTTDSTTSFDKSVIIQETITGLTANFNKISFYSGETTNLDISVDNVEGAQYCIHWGETAYQGKCDVISNNTSFSHTFQNLGIFPVYVQAFNSVSKTHKITYINMLGILHSISFFDPVLKIMPVITGSPFYVQIIANGSGPAQLDYSCGTSNYVFNVTLAESFLFEAAYTVDAPEDLLCTVTIRNALDSMSVSAYAIVQDAIEDLSITAPLYVESGGPTEFLAYTLAGTNITYHWIWDDGFEDYTNGTYNLHEILHSYTVNGNKTITLFAWNKVSSTNATTLVIIQERCGEILFTRDSLNTEFNDNTVVTFAVLAGSELNLWIEYGTIDENLDLVKSPVASGMNILGTAIYGRGSYVYKNIGSYTVSVHCQNVVSVSNTEKMVHVQEGIKAVNVTVIQQFEGGENNYLDYIEVNEILTLAIESKGSQLTYVYNLDDGSENITTTDMNITFFYSQWKETPYNVSVTTFNAISRVIQYIPLMVHRPVQNLSGFEIFNVPTNLTDPVLFNLQIEFGDFFTCTWDFGDGSPTVDVSYETFLSENGTVYHTYFEGGLYDVVMNCSNRLHNVTKNVNSSSFVAVTDFNIYIYSDCNDGNGLIAGGGLDANIFDVSCDVVIVLQNQEGSDVLYDIKYGFSKGKPIVEEKIKSNETRYKYEFPDESTYFMGNQIEIIAYNPTSVFEKSTEIIIIGGISNVSVQFDEGINRIGMPSNISVTVESLAYKACYELDLGDSRQEVAKIVFGDEDCQAKPEYAFHQYVAVTLIPNVYVPLVTHLYDEIKTFSLTVTAKNDVSDFTAPFELQIKDMPCFKPKLSWDSAMAHIASDVPDLSSFFRCRRYPILTKTLTNCFIKTAVVQRSWSLKRITVTNDTDIYVNEIIEVPGNDTRFVISERQLEYGMYELQYNASMYDNKRGTFVEDTEELIIGYFEIKQCDLLAKIVGGSGRAVGQGDEAVINATESNDPDIDPSLPNHLNYHWYCKQENTEVSRKETFVFDQLIDYPEAPYPAASNATMPKSTFRGCFGNGPGQLKPEVGNPGVLRLNTSFMMFSQRYNILLRLSQTGRQDIVELKYELKVVFGTPPIVSISCKLNCLTKKNPTQKISLVAVCLNCGSMIPVYSWSMISRPSTAGDGSEVNENELLKASATTNINKDKNLVIKPGSLKENTDYIVKLSVYWDANDIENQGFSKFDIVMNSPPVMDEFGTCYMNTDFGKALETQFYITCESINDDDQPLTYSWFYKTKQSSTEWKPCTFPRQGRPESEMFTLSPGDPDRGNMVSIKIVASDLYGASMEPYLMEVKVDPKPMDSAAVGAMLDDPNVLSDPATLGNVMNGLLDSMESSVATANLDVTAVKDKMIGMLAEVKIDSPAGCSMVAGTLDGAADENNEMSDDSMDKSLKAAANVASFGAELSPEELAEITAKTLSAASKFTANAKGDKAADSLKAARESESQLTSGAAANMVAGEAPLTLKTAGGETKVSCFDPSDKSSDLGGFELPDMESDGGGCTGATNSEGKNRYGFDESAKGVHGNTKGLGLSAGFGKKKVVKNLPKPIRLVMPNTDPIPPPESHPAYCELMRVVHLVDCSVNSSNIFMKIEPWYNNFTGNFFVFMNKGTSPSLIDNQHNCTLPQPYPDNWGNMSDAQKQHFENEEKWRCFITAAAMEDYCEGRWCVGVVYYTNTTNKTSELLPRSTPVEDAVCKKVNYTFYAYTRACLYWSESKKRWSNEGCVASTETKDNETICYCDHLTDFGGGGPFAEPQPIDFGAAFSGFSNLGDNPTVFSVVLSLIAVYVLMLIWARRKDKKDKIKVAICPLESNHQHDTNFYEISVQTGYVSSASTTSEVFIIIRGTQSETLPKQLINPNRPCFQKSETDNFLMAVPYSLGKLTDIEIWHNNTGASPGWYLMQVQIRNCETETLTLFVNNRWLDVAEDDGMICRTIEPAQKSDLTEFGYAFATTLRKNLYDGHIWFSVFTRPLNSTFTTVQRLSTCFSLLLTTMLANAMFYTGDDKPPSMAIHLGPIVISLDQIRVGITSALIVIPANLLIVTLFKKAGPKRDKTKEKYVSDDADTPRSVLDNQAAAELNEEDAPEAKQEKFQDRVVNFFRSILFPGREDDETEKKKKKKNPLPHWLIYIAYFFVFVTSAVSAFFVMMYGFMFGKSKSDSWVLSMVISFLQSVFLIQPVKVLVLSVLFAYLTKDPMKEEENNRSSNTSQRAIKDKIDSDEDSELEDHAANAFKKKPKTSFKLPDERRLEESRQMRLMEKRIKAIIKEIVIHLMFVLICLMVAYAASDPASFDLAESVRNLAEKNGVTSSYFKGKTYNEEIDRKVKKAAEVSNRLEWFDWMRFSVVEYLFPIGWYNGDKDYEAGFVADNEASKVLAMARIRQLRVKNNTCTKLPTFEHLIVECNAGYSIGNVEQTKNFHYGWTPALNRTMRLRLRRGKRKAMYLGYETPWQYSSAMELSAFPFFGRFATYSGSSYSVSIGPKKKFAKKIVEQMKKYFWVDRYTRALITEANIYNANTNLMVIVTMLHEILPTGGWSFFYNIQSLRLYRYIGGLGSVIMLFDFIFVIITLVGLYKAIKHSRRKGVKAYISNTWNLLHVIVTGCSIGAIACTIGRALFVRWAVAQYNDEPELFVSFAYVGQLEYFILAFIGFVVFFANLEFLRILRFNRRIGLLTKTMSVVGKPLYSFAILFLIIFMAYVSTVHCLFVDKEEGFSTLIKSFVELMKMFLGQFDIHKFLGNAPTLGPILFFTYMLAIQMILINMFIGIVCDSFAAVREESDLDDDTNVLSYMSSRMKSITNNNVATAMPIYNEWKTDWEVMMEDFDEKCNSVIFNMKSCESDEIRQTKWFGSSKDAKKKQNLLAAIIGVDYLMYENEILDSLQLLERKLKKMSIADTQRFLQAAVLKRQHEDIQEEKDGRLTVISGNSEEFSSSDEENDDSDGESE